MNSKRSITSLQIIWLAFSGVMASAAFAGPPQPLPVLQDLHPCELSASLPGAATQQAVFPCSVIVISEADAEAASAAIAVAGAAVLFNFPGVQAAAGVISAQASLDKLATSAGVKVIPDRRINAFPKFAKPGGGGSVSGQSVPDGVSRIGAQPGALTVDGAGVGVAIVDTGVDLSHADLNVSALCFDAYNEGCNDKDGHGTHVAGIVAARDNNIDVVGVAPGATIYAVRVLGPMGGTDSAVMAGLQWVLNNATLVNPPIKVVNMSLGREGSVGDNPAFDALMTQVRDAGIAIAVAAGNDPALESWQNIPAAYSAVMSVASTTAAGGSNQCRGYGGVIGANTASFFTTDGRGITISAPGETSENINRACFIQSNGILSLNAGGGTTRMSGTSMASPHVAGVLALLAEQQGAAFNPEAARGMIQQGATGINSLPLNSPSSAYTYDGAREGVLSACGALGSC